MKGHVGVNLLWLVPGVVGGSEEYTVRLLEGLSERSERPQITLFALKPFGLAHPHLTAAYPTVTLSLSGRRKPLRVVAENSWLVAQARRRNVDLARYDVRGPFFCYPAITYPHKNHLMLVEAFARVVERQPGASLVLTGGEAQMERRLARRVAELGLSDSVRRIGRVPRADLDALLGAATALTFPSRFEGFGIPVLEAMARGLPVIAARATAIPEVVGDAGILLPPTDPEAWADAMVDILEVPSERTRLAAAGRRRVAEFSRERAATRLVEAYRQALEA